MGQGQEDSGNGGESQLYLGVYRYRHICILIYTGTLETHHFLFTLLHIKSYRSRYPQLS